MIKPLDVPQLLFSIAFAAAAGVVSGWTTWRVFLLRLGLTHEASLYCGLFVMAATVAAATAFDT